MPEHRAATVEFDRVTKVYDAGGAGGTTSAPGAVNDLSLHVPAGRICVLVGPSGCGKTTSLRMVNRLVEPTRGRVLIDGVDVATRDVVELRRSIGYVIQQTGLFPHQTVAENVATVPQLLGWPDATRRARSDELLTLVGLDPVRYGRRYPAELSGGERQRVGVARALAADPPIMLMDEPFGAVDPIVRGRLQDEFLRLQEQLAKTILFVTHDIDEAIKMGDLVAVMEDAGRLAQAGPPAAILARPASDLVARFVGADRGLKRLSLGRVGDLALTAPSAGYEAATARPTAPRFDSRTTLRDALSILLDASVRAGLVVDRDDRVLGSATVDDIAAWMRGPAPGETGAAGGEDDRAAPAVGAGATDGRGTTDGAGTIDGAGMTDGAGTIDGAGTTDDGDAVERADGIAR